METSNRALGKYPYLDSYISRGVVVVFITLLSVNALATDFWETKDWTRWSELQCDSFLVRDGAVSSSPWMKESANSVPSFGSVFVNSTKVQFRSALPVRLAIARMQQIKSRYHQMTAEQRHDFDQKIDSELRRSFEEKVVVHIRLVATQGGKRASATSSPQPATVTLTLPNGNQIRSSEPTSVVFNEAAGSVEYEVAFPRLLDGHPLLKPGDRKFKVWGIEFDASKMFFRGKLEY